jgi:hypothetical protein
MFVDCCVGGGRYFLYYSYRRNPTGGRRFFSHRNLIAVKRYKEFLPESLVLKIPTGIPTNQYQYMVYQYQYRPSCQYQNGIQL